MSVTFGDILEFWAVGYGAMLAMMVIVCLAVNKKFLKDIVNWVIIMLLSVLSWMGFVFMIVAFGMAYIDYIKNNKYDKDSEK